MEPYEVRPGVVEQARVRAHERQAGEPASRPLRIYSVDPSLEGFNGAVATIAVPYEPLEPGPVGRFFEVVCMDGGVPLAPLNLDDPRVLIQSGLAPSTSNPAFHQQMVYAVASSVYATFRSALGRLIAWAHDAGAPAGTGRLKLWPHASGEGANASYDKVRREIRFGHSGDSRLPGSGRVFACLSHDVIAHEVTHALVDGLRARFTIPTNPDVLGLHEGLADLVALLHRFLYKDVVTVELRRAGLRVEHSAILTRLAAEFARAAGVPGGPRSVVDQGPERMFYKPTLAPHEMGNVLVAAVFDAFLAILRRKTERLMRLAGDAERPSEDLVQLLAAQASQLARQFLNICIRAIDYCPPVDVELGEYLRALLTADFNLVRDDPWGYRETLIRAFADRRIYPRGVIAMSEDALLWRPPSRHLPPIENLGFSALRFNGDPSAPASADELLRQAHVLGEYLTRSPEIAEFGLMPPGGAAEPFAIQSIRMARRVGPDDQVLFDLVAEVTQRRIVNLPGGPASAKFVGGSTLIIGPKGEIRYVISKNIGNQARIERQSVFQSTSGMWKRDPGGQYHLVGPTLHLTHRARAEASRANTDQ
jgi:hypothetical protein